MLLTRVLATRGRWVSVFQSADLPASLVSSRSGERVGACIRPRQFVLKCADEEEGGLLVRQILVFGHFDEGRAEHGDRVACINDLEKSRTSADIRALLEADELTPKAADHQCKGANRCTLRLER